MLVKFDLGNTNVVFSLDDENKENKNIREIFERMRFMRNTHNFFFLFFSPSPQPKRLWLLPKINFKHV